MIDLSIIIVSYNTKDFLQKCLQSVYACKPKHFSFEVIVVDNASSDDSVEMIQKEFSQVHVLASHENLGFSKANNKGVAIAKGRYVLFLNPDTVMSADVLDGMVQFMEEHRDGGGATCKLVMENGDIDYAIHRGFPTPWNAFTYFSGLGKLFATSKIFSGYTQGWKDLNTTHEVDAIAGAFMMVRREAGEDIGWWDEEYFFNGEDLDFCFMLKQKGWKIYYVPAFTMLHYNGVAGGTKKHSQTITTVNKEHKRKIQEIRFNAMKIFYRKHYQDQYPGIVTWLINRGIDLKLWITLQKS